MKGFETAVVLLLAASVPALAQMEPAEKITVFAPYIVKKSNSGAGRTPVTTITISQEVSYQDLDLRSEIGLTTLVGRVRQAAEDICRELGRRYPKSIYVPVSEDKDCAKNAEANGMMEVHAVVAAARTN